MLKKMDKKLEIWINEFVDKHPILFTIIFVLLCSVGIN